MSLILFSHVHTTGLPLYALARHSEAQPHIVQAAAKLVESESRGVEHTMNLIARPDGWGIDADATAVHGIDHARALAVGIPENLIVYRFLEMWRLCNVRVFQRASFGNQIWRIALSRYANASTRKGWEDTPSESLQSMTRKESGIANMSIDEAYERWITLADNKAADAMACVERLEAVYFALTDICQAEEAQAK